MNWKPRTSPRGQAAALALSLIVALAAPAADKELPRLRVSENQRYLVTTDGKPFFWLGDTAWELFHRLNREERQATSKTGRVRALPSSRRSRWRNSMD